MEQNTLTGTARHIEIVFNAKGQRNRTEHHVRLEVPLRQVNAEQAPVAALLPGSSEFRSRWPKPAAEIRTLDGLLYRQQFTHGREPLKPGANFPARDLILDFGGHHGIERAEAAIHDGLGQYILIDGEIWTAIVEPVITIGAGNSRLRITSTPGKRYGAFELFSVTELDAAIDAQRTLPPIRTPGRRRSSR